MTTPRDLVQIREVGPRDGLQNEPPVAIEDRVRLIDSLSTTGLRAIEAVSFVRADAILAMAGAAEGLAAINRPDGVRFSALVPNARGAELAVAEPIDGLEVVVSASNTHSHQNVRMSTGDALDAAANVIAIGHDAQLSVEAVISTAFGCPYEGEVDPVLVATMAVGLLDDGADMLAFGDTTGMATPRQVNALLDALVAAGVGVGQVAMHFHNTRNTGLVNIVTALDRGVRVFDASIGGLGGCPYAPGATGNVPTEDVVHLVEELGYDTGIDLDALIESALLAEQIVGRTLPGQVMRAGPRLRTVNT
ncbi:MAG: hydroxymethylglutaryl-CoA lyase [Acidimicrobiales bacterium]